MRIRYGRPGLDARLDGGARVVHVHMDVPQPVAADHDERVAEGVEPGRSRADGRVLGLQQVDHLEGGTVLRRRPRRVGRRPPAAAAGRPGRRRHAVVTRAGPPAPDRARAPPP